MTPGIRMINEPAMIRPHCTASEDQNDMTATVAVWAFDPVQHQCENELVP